MKSKVDVIVVGAGPAGVAAAYLLAKAGLEVVIFERGEYPGSKNVFGGVLYTSVLEQLFPSFREQAPLERPITKRSLVFLTDQAMLSVNLWSERFNRQPYNGFTVLRTKFDPWFADQAVAAGARLVNETVVDDLIWEDGRVVGIKARRDLGELRANVVIAADGANSLLAKRAGLRRDFRPEQLSLGVKELIRLPREVIEERFSLVGEEGSAFEFIGGLPAGTMGGGYLYTNRDSLSVGVVAQVASLKATGVRIEHILDEFKQHPQVAGLLRGGTIKEYAAHLIPEGGLEMMPKLYTDGFMVVGDAAGLVLATGLHFEGANYAIASGVAAAEAIKEAFSKGDFSGRSLSRYSELLESSPVMANLRRFRHAPSLLQNPRLYSTYPELFCEVGEELIRSRSQPHSKLLPLVLSATRRKVGLRQAVQDFIQFARSLLW